MKRTESGSGGPERRRGSSAEGSKSAAGAAASNARSRICTCGGTGALSREVSIPDSIGANAKVGAGCCRGTAPTGAATLDCCSCGHNAIAVCVPYGMYHCQHIHILRFCANAPPLALTGCPPNFGPESRLHKLTLIGTPRRVCGCNVCSSLSTCSSLSDSMT